MKKIYMFLAIAVILLSASSFIYNKKDKINYVDYNGFKLAMSVDGENVTTLPSANYYLVSYECNNGTTLSWDKNTGKLISENNNVNDMCYLSFESSPKLYDLSNIGDYIEYTGDNGCSDNQCIGRNASQTNTNIYNNYGYCSTSNNKFYTYGWRVLYKKDNSVYIVSAGAPECVAGVSGNAASTKNNLNEATLKYCNASYISGGSCEPNVAPVHAFNEDDFNKFTIQYYAKTRYLYKSDDLSVSCATKRSSFNCGYNNDVIDNGGYYRFASEYNNTDVLYWDPTTRSIASANNTTSYGIRPVLKLDASIKVTEGNGTMEIPYTISKREQK